MIKIIIFGFPHCGTSILKSIIGHIEDVEEIINETSFIRQKTNKKYILCKYPFMKDKFFGNIYRDYIKIFIIRNPIYIYSSLNKRFEYNIPERHGIDKYINTIQKFIYYKNNPQQNTYTIRYEDMFHDNFKELKNIFNNIGFRYTNDIFNNSKYINKLFVNEKVSKEKPLNIEHSKYRTWQINQPFISNNNPSKIDLNNEQLKIIMNNKDILKIYPNINKQVPIK